MGYLRGRTLCIFLLGDVPLKEEPLGRPLNAKRFDLNFTRELSVTIEANLGGHSMTVCMYDCLYAEIYTHAFFLLIITPFIIFFKEYIKKCYICVCIINFYKILAQHPTANFVH